MQLSFGRDDAEPEFQPQTLHILFERAEEVEGLYKLLNTQGSSDSCKVYNIKTSNIKSLIREMYPKLDLLGMEFKIEGGLLVP